MMDPLLHLVRNAVSHGIEPAPEREAAGKWPQGRIRLRAFTEGDSVGIDVEDDGRGIDIARVAKRARECGLITPDAELDPSALLDILSAPTFTTQDHPDRESGRGIGLNVVKSSVEALNGSISLSTHAGGGTRFRIQLPLTLAIADALIATVGGQRFAVPQGQVREIIAVDSESVRVLEGNEVIPHRGGVLPLVRLANVFGIRRDGSPPSGHACVVGSGATAVGLVVDRVAARREIVVHAVSDPLLRIPGIGGATEIGDGAVVLILDVQTLLAASRAANATPMPAS
jgi:two-component system chemotaxis sensor kinase CheA